MSQLPQVLPGEVGQARAHESAALHVAGEATYTDDIAELQGTLHAARRGWRRLTTTSCQRS
jgi:xanthine dehydrogenase molybdopterin-binding subunit B